MWVEGHNKHQSRNKWNSLKKHSIKDQWNQEVVVWKDKQGWQTFNHTHQEEKEDPNKISNTREVITDTTEVQGIVRKYYKLYTNRLDNCDEMYKSLETHNPILSQEESEDLDRQITTSETEVVITKIKKHPTNKHPKPMASQVNSTKH